MQLVHQAREPKAHSRGLGMMLALFQNLGVLSMVDVKWPDEVSNLLALPGRTHQ